MKGQNEFFRQPYSVSHHGFLLSVLSSLLKWSNWKLVKTDLAKNLFQPCWRGRLRKTNKLYAFFCEPNLETGVRSTFLLRAKGNNGLAFCIHTYKTENNHRSEEIEFYFENFHFVSSESPLSQVQNKFEPNQFMKTLQTVCNRNHLIQKALYISFWTGIEYRGRMLDKTKTLESGLSNWDFQSGWNFGCMISAGYRSSKKWYRSH